jgi:hypothetical protein
MRGRFEAPHLPRKDLGQHTRIGSKSAVNRGHECKDALPRDERASPITSTLHRARSPLPVLSTAFPFLPGKRRTSEIPRGPSG